MTAEHRLSRRLAGLAGFVGLLAAALPIGAAAQTACGRPTPGQTAGPFYKSGAPERADLADTGKQTGPKVELTGQVLDRRCQPVPHAQLDVWQADGLGRYDNSGYRMRGRVRADGEGRYRLSTILPGRYDGRTRHIHVKVAAPDGPVLTTQLYFPGERGNRADGLFRPDLVVKTAKSSGTLVGRFDFVLDER